MIAEPIAVQMAIQSTHRNMNDAARERAPRPRRATARVRQAIAIRLDPAVAQKPSWAEASPWTTAWDAPWYSAEGSADVLLARRRVGMANLVCCLRDGDRVFETYWTRGRGFEVMAPSYGLLDMTVHGRQEMGEDAPAGWPRRWGGDGAHPYRTDGRPIAQWSRLQAGRSDDLGSGAVQ